MAGIGFTLRKLLRHETLYDLGRTYAYAGVIGSGPWALSILSLILIGIAAVLLGVHGDAVLQFLTTVTHLIAGSMLWAGVVQLLFVRFVADRVFLKETDRVLPNLMGVLTSLAGGGALLIFLTFPLFREQSRLFCVLLLVGFVELSLIWILAMLVTGLKEYKPLLSAFFWAYVLTVLLCLDFSRLGLEGLLAGFVIGQGMLCFALGALIIREYPSDTFLSFAFLNRRHVHWSLGLSGFLYALGIWIDKFLFWQDPVTSMQVLGPLRISPIYDPPLFVAYLATIPGMAVFLVRMETDFSESYEQFYQAIITGGTLDTIQRLKDEMVIGARQGILEIFKIQGLTVMILILVAPSLLPRIGLPAVSVPLFSVLTVATGFNVVLLGILNVLSYLDRRQAIAWLTALFATSNGAGTYVTIVLGSPFYGYGYACAGLLTCVIGLQVLSRTFWDLEYETFMLRR